jgi:hypothetical protein
MSFAYRVPATQGVAQVDLVGPSGTLDTLHWSAHAPTVAIQTPINNRVATLVNGRIHVVWNGTDADGNRLLYTVLYSNDGGHTFEAQSVEQSATSFDVNLGTGSTHWVKVAVSDGARSASSAPIAFGSESPASFAGRLAAAFRAGTASHLVGLLDPAVIARYGVHQCASYLGSIREPTLSYVVRSTIGPVPWTYASDGRSTVIPTVYSLGVDRTQHGATDRVTVHIGIRAGSLTFFADCGTPL